MASAAKIAALTLLTLGLVLAGLGTFLPAGENWLEEEGVRDTETFTLFTYTLEVTSGDALVREDTYGWSDDRVADHAGATAMLASGIVAVGALLLTLVGTILAYTPRASRAGGVVAILGAAAVAATTVLAIVGMRARTDEVLGTASGLIPLAGVFLLAAAFLLVLVGGVVVASVRRASDDAQAVDPWEDYPAHVEARNAARAQADGEARTLRCPDCGTTARVAAGIVPTCSSCGFHRRDAPAAVPTFDAPDAAWS